MNHYRSCFRALKTKVTPFRVEPIEATIGSSACEKAQHLVGELGDHLCHVL
jgi:hypothetical protein